MKILALVLVTLAPLSALAGVYNGTTKCQRFAEGGVLEFYGDCDATSGGNMAGSFTDIKFPVTIKQGQFGSEYDAVKTVEVRLSSQATGNNSSKDDDKFIDVDGNVSKIYSRAEVEKLGWNWQYANKPIIKTEDGDIVHPVYGTFRWESM